jgi:hypothetical protein
VARFVLLTHLVKKVGGIFISTGVAPDGVGNDNARAAANN